MKIVEITRSGVGLPDGVPITLRVGKPVIEGGNVVKEIIYCRDGYSKGSHGRKSCYAVKFDVSPEVRVISEDLIIDMAIDPETDTKKKSEVDLPD